MKIIIPKSTFCAGARCMNISRFDHNPLIQPGDVLPSRSDFEVIGVLNAGVAQYNDEVILLLRVVERPRDVEGPFYPAPIFDPDSGQVVRKDIPRHAPGHDFSDPRVIGTPEGTYLTALSHLRVARSRDGVHFSVDETPAMFPANAYETYGMEDPRITKIDGTYYINYVAVSQRGIVTALAETSDFHTYRRLGIIFHPDNKDVVIFPEKINGKYYALHRPSISAFGRPEIWLAESPDLLCWGNHRHLIGRRQNGWEDARIGASAVPFCTDKGWLEIYHGANQANRYCLMALLLDANEPWRVLARSERPFLEPEADYEVSGFFGNAVFSCGALLNDNMVTVYYGAADTCIAGAQITLDDLFFTMKPA